MIRKRSLLTAMLALLLAAAGSVVAQNQTCPRSNCPNPGQNCPNGQCLRKGNGAKGSPAVMKHGARRGAGMGANCPRAMNNPPVQENKK